MGNKETHLSRCSLIKLNWDDLTSDGVVTGFAGLVNTLDLKVSGRLDLNIAGFVLAAGNFEMTQQSGLTIDDSVNVPLTNVSLLTVNITEVYLFVGWAATLPVTLTASSPALISPTSTVGFHVTGASLALAIASEDQNAADTAQLDRYRGPHRRHGDRGPARPPSS